MVKKWIAVGVALLLMAILVVGCGVPQEDYDAMIAERDTGLAKAASLESDLSATESTLAATESDLSATEGDLAATQSDLAATQSELADAESQISSLKSAANKAKSDLAATQEEYSTFKSDLDGLWDSLEKKLDVQAELIDMYNGAAKLETGEMSVGEYLAWMATFMATMGTKIDAVENTELSQLWEDFFSYAAQGDESKMGKSLTGLADLTRDLIDQDIEALEAKLSE